MLTTRDQSRPAGRSGRFKRPRGKRAVGYLVVAAALIAAIAAVVTLAGGQRPKAAPPPPAKPFSLAELGHPGTRITLAGYTGRPLIVNFFASWCAPCQRETPMLARFYAAEHGRVTIIGIDSIDQTAAALKFIARTGVRYPVAADPYPATATTSYGVYALPQTFFLNARHRIVSHVLGPLTMKDLTRGVALMDKDRG